MHIKVRCQCGAALAAPAEKAGLRCRCPKCGASVQIPASSPPRAEQPAGAHLQATSSAAQQHAAHRLANTSVLPPKRARAAQQPEIDLPDMNSELDELGLGSSANLDLLALAGGPGHYSMTAQLQPFPLGGQRSSLPPWFWAVAGVGVTVVLGLVVMVTMLAMRSDSHQPSASEVASAASNSATAAAPLAVMAPAPAISSTAALATAKVTPASAPVVVQQPAAAPPVPSGRVTVNASVADIIDSVEDGVVLITTYNSAGKELGLGSGFVVDATGLVGTNFHVIADCYSAKVQFRDGSKCDVAGVRAHDRSRDLAILQLRNQPPKIHVLPMRTDQNPRTGCEVIAIGHPRGFQFTVTTGIVSAVHTTADLPDDVRDFLKAPSDNVWIQTNAAISGGNSGGPLLNMQGEVLGINTWVASGQNLGFATHVRHLAELQGKLAPNPRSLAELQHETGPGGFLKEISPEVTNVLEEFKEQFAEFTRDVNSLKQQGATKQQMLQLVATQNPLPMFTRRLLDLAGEHRQTPVAFQALSMICALAEFPSGVAYPADAYKKALDQLIEDHLDHPQMADLLLLLAKTEEKQIPDFGRRVIEAAAEPELRGKACLALAISLMSRKWTERAAKYTPRPISAQSSR